ncbi:MAG: hypothetical protein GY810_15180 [Aureispira sp.]|nr:hypothetical protein [Aureispira sp.]
MKSIIGLLLMITIVGMTACKKKGPQITITTPEENAILTEGNDNLHIQASITDKKGILDYSVSLLNLGSGTIIPLEEKTSVSHTSVTIDIKQSLFVKGEISYKLNIHATNISGTASTSELTFTVKD